MCIHTNTRTSSHTNKFLHLSVLVSIVFVIYKPVHTKYMQIHANTCKYMKNPNTDGGKTPSVSQVCIWHVFGCILIVLACIQDELVCICMNYPPVIHTGFAPMSIQYWLVLACICLYWHVFGMYFACIKKSIQKNSNKNTFLGSTQSIPGVILRNTA